MRPGADRQVPVSTRLPEASAPTAGYESQAMPDDATQSARIGSVVPAEGGQQAQKAKEEEAIAGIKKEWARERTGEPPAAATQ